MVFQVALRRKTSGYVTDCSAGHTVPYIICCQEVYLISLFALVWYADVIRGVL